MVFTVMHAALLCSQSRAKVGQPGNVLKSNDIHECGESAVRVEKPNVRKYDRGVASQFHEIVDTGFSGGPQKGQFRYLPRTDMQSIHRAWFVSGIPDCFFGWLGGVRRINRPRNGSRRPALSFCLSSCSTSRHSPKLMRSIPPWAAMATFTRRRMRLGNRGRIGVCSVPASSNG